MVQTRSRVPRHSRSLRCFSLLLFTAIVGVQIAGPVPIGLANNGDFARVLGGLEICLPDSVANDAHLYFHYFVNDYKTGCPRYNAGVPSSERIIAALAKTLARVWLPAGTFRLSMMGLIHAAIFVLALFVFLQALRAHSLWIQASAAALALLVWTDLRYVEQLNTAYTDTGAVLALILLFSLGIHWAHGTGGRLLPVSFALAACFLLAAKTQHEIALPFLAGFCLLAGFRTQRRSTRALWCITPLLLGATTVWMIRKTREDYRIPPAVTVVFYKLAVLAPDPRRVLADFHMPEQEFLKYAGHYAYEREVPLNDPAFRRRILSLVTPASLASFYLRRPTMLRKVLWYDLTAWAPDVDLTSSGYGHLREPDVESGRRPFELTAWSRFRRGLFRLSPLHVVFLFIFVIALSGLCMSRPRIAARLPLWPLTLLTTLIAVSSFLSASLLDGVETARHLVLFQTATDLTIISLVLSILLWPKRRGPG